MRRLNSRAGCGEREVRIPTSGPFVERPARRNDTDLVFWVAMASLVISLIALISVVRGAA